MQVPPQSHVAFWLEDCIANPNTYLQTHMLMEERSLIFSLQLRTRLHHSMKSMIDLSFLCLVLASSGRLLYAWYCKIVSRIPTLVDSNYPPTQQEDWCTIRKLRPPRIEQIVSPQVPIGSCQVGLDYQFCEYKVRIVMSYVTKLESHRQLKI